MTQAPFDRISQFYNSRVAKFGHHSKACDYGSDESQLKKFQILSSVYPMRGRTILDVGCGFADYADYLHSRYGTVEYRGVDLSEAMIAQALTRHPGLDLKVYNILDEPAPKERNYDVVSANGIFYLLGSDARSIMQRLVRAMYARAKVGIAFSSLSSWAKTQDAGEFYADPLETLAWCREITPWVTLRHDYMPHDFSVFMYREQIALET